MSNEKPMKPATRKVPKWLRFGFIGFEVALLAFHGVLVFRDPNLGRRNPVALDFWLAVDFSLAFTLLASTVVLYFRFPRLADSGLAVIVLWIVMSGLGPSQL